MVHRKLIVLRMVSAVAIVAWAAFIFGFSGQTGGESGGLSARVADVLVSVGDWLTGAVTMGEARAAAIEALQFPIRKAAHMSEYAVLALLVFAQLRLWPAFSGTGLPPRGKLEIEASSTPASPWDLYLRTLRKAALVAWGCAALYAATDEVHQLFVPGRAGLFTDVLIDATGAAIGLLVAGSIIALVKRPR